MTTSRNSDSPLSALSAGEQATEAFELLSNETRLAILVALWEHDDPFGDDALRFSELQSRVGTADSGQFNYHLDRLDGHFVESVDGGYRLTNAGRKFVRSVIAGTGIESPVLEPTEVDVPCTLCGAAVEVEYERGQVYVTCTECEGLWNGDDDHSGHLAKFSLDPAGLEGRSPDEIYAAAWVNTFQTIYSMIEGVCPTCTGQVERILAVCSDHDANGQCDQCGHRSRAIARFRCTVCKRTTRATLGVVAKYHPRVVALCYDHGLDLQYDFNELAHIAERFDRTSTDVEYRSLNPPRVRVTTTINGDDAWVELAEDLSVVDVSD
ncbi:winged helix-turn-helix domain-containing protein [Halobacterium sp. KA-4]|uniref:winged helix-turn-helix domain-containing protein n=1 Tax=Halobacterium sp. KA-4 TaxID=2896367 RepID=UPI001E48BDAA|nr:winged helix-turn-helix domain-containing protein [Halobacterium sp. KA-4]MCD2199180.1 winged helix-turn-helix domain-containing protein [Halobacterium sp. KA-4]